MGVKRGERAFDTGRSEKLGTAQYNNIVVNYTTQLNKLKIYFQSEAYKNITKKQIIQKVFCLSCKIYSSALMRFCKRTNELYAMSCRVQLCYHMLFYNIGYAQVKIIKHLLSYLYKA